jgi:hypothetical protein
MGASTPELWVRTMGLPNHLPLDRRFLPVPLLIQGPGSDPGLYGHTRYDQIDTGGHSGVHCINAIRIVGGGGSGVSDVRFGCELYGGARRRQVSIWPSEP